MLLYWLGRGISNDRRLVVPWDEAPHSLGASALAALVTVAAAIPVAVLVHRRLAESGGWSRVH